MGKVLRLMVGLVMLLTSLNAGAAGGCGVKAWMLATNDSVWSTYIGFKPLTNADTITNVVFLRRDFNYNKNSDTTYTGWDLQTWFWPKIASTTTQIKESSSGSQVAIVTNGHVAYPSFSASNYFFSKYYATNHIAWQEPVGLHPAEWGGTYERSSAWIGPGTEVSVQVASSNINGTISSSSGTNGAGPHNNFSLSDFGDIPYTSVTPTAASGSFSNSYSGFGYFQNLWWTTTQTGSGNGSVSLTLSDARSVTNLAVNPPTKPTILDVKRKLSVLGYYSVSDTNDLRALYRSLGVIRYEIYAKGPEGVALTVNWEVNHYSKDGIWQSTTPYSSTNLIGTGEVQLVYEGLESAIDDEVEVKMKSVTSGCDSGACSVGEILNWLGSAEVEMSLGKAADGYSLGSLEIHEQLPSAGMYTPAKLQPLLFGEGAEVLSDGNGLRQVRAIECFVDVAVINSNKYEVRYYAPLASSATKGTNGFYSPGGSAITVNTIEALGGDTNKLRVSHVKSGVTNVSDFEYSWTDGGWWLTTGGGMKKEFLGKEVDEENGITTKTSLVKNSGNELLSKSVTKLLDFGEDYGKRIIEQTDDPDGAAKTTRWAYYDDVENDGAAYGKVKMVVYPTGRWQRYQYDQYGRETNIVSQFGNSATNAAENASRVTQYTYLSYNTNLDKMVLQTNVPRRTIEKLLGEEIGRSYTVIGTNEEWSVRCQTPGASITATDNLKTVKKTFTKSGFDGIITTVLNPDGTMTLEEAPRYSATNSLVTKVYSGVPNEAGTAIVDGTMTVTLNGTNGSVLTTASYDIITDVQLSGQAYTYDSNGRVTRVDYSDGTYTLNSYGCCNLESSTDRNGLVTSYVYDNLKRQIATVRNGITYSNWLDADGRTLASYKIAGGTTIVTARNGYDSMGNIATVTNALNQTTRFAEWIDGSGQEVRATTNAELGTRIETYFKDGSLKSVTGTAVHGLRYEYGVETVDGVARAFTKQILLETNGTDTAEWVENYTDMVGRTIKTVYADGAANRQLYNAKGQLWKKTDPDNVTMLFQYNAKGDQEYVALDMDRNDQIDFAGTDRITRMVTDVLKNPSIVNVETNLGVQRIRTYRWEQDGVDFGTLISTGENSTDGRRTWSLVGGLVSSSQTVYGTNGWQYVTNINSDGSCTVQESQYGLLKVHTKRDINKMQFSKQSYLYDRFGRALSVIDSRNGAAATLYDSLDRPVVEVSNLGAVSYNDSSSSLDCSSGSFTIDYTDPYLVSGFPTNAQVTTTWLTITGQPWRIQHPDLKSVTNEYHLTGELKKTCGARTYPVEYTYDNAGRQKSQKTWKNFAGNSGVAVTTWNYMATRGFVISKLYADDKGPAFEYTAGGRISKRTWARGTHTDYAYNNAGDLVSVTYSDDTPDVTYTYDRAGRRKTVTQGAQDAVAYSYNALGLMTGESHTSGLLAGITVTNAFDAYGRRQTLSVLQGATSIYRTGYGYDAASRLQTVSLDGHNATYAYHTNSPLIENITFQKFGEARLTTVKGYDTLNRLTNIVSTPSAAGEDPISYAYQYNTANQRTRATLYDGSYWEYGYDSLGQVTNGTKRFANGTAVNAMGFGYEYDDIGNRTSTSVANRPTTRTGGYGANLLNQYTNRTVPGVLDISGIAHTNALVTVNGNSATRQGNLFWLELTPNNTNAPVWQMVTNIASLAGAGQGGSDIVRSNAGAAYVSPTPETYTYDEDGNLTSDGRWIYTWDAENRLLQMETSMASVAVGVPKKKLEFAYDQEARRIQKKVSDWDGVRYTAAYTNRFIYDGWVLISVLDNVGVKQSNLWGNDLSGSRQNAGGVGGLLAVQDKDGQTWFSVYDGNGNVVAFVSGADGFTIARVEYGPFGEMLKLDRTKGFRDGFNYSTQYQDVETELIYYIHRYYSRYIGRWINRDVLTDETPDIYGFIANDPINGFDVLGGWGDKEHYDALESWTMKVAIARKQNENFTFFLWHCLRYDVNALLKEGNDRVDATGGHLTWKEFDNAQGEENSYQHAMKSPKQSVEEARNLFYGFVSRKIQQAKLDAGIARQFAKTGNMEMAQVFMKSAIIGIGEAQHPVADSMSPMHAGFQTWYWSNSLSVTWPVKNVAIPIYWLKHHLGESKAIFLKNGNKDKTIQAIDGFVGSAFNEIIKE